MMKIEQIKAQADRVGRYAVTLSDGSTMRLYRQTIEDFCLYNGMELSEETFEKLQQSAGEMSAKMRAVRIVSASGVSSRDLKQRLIQKGEKYQDADNAVNWLEELSLLDDRKTAEQIVNRCISKGYGIARAKQALYEKRIPKEFWADALNGYPEQEEKIMEFLSSKLDANSDEKQVRKTIDALIRRGHSYSTVRRCLSALSMDTDHFPEG